jgi:oxygen-independent coproporphyrinogen-3 oxidase
MDLMYGLPHQTAKEVERTADLTAAVAPARIALFGYAHVPWMKTHQRLIDAAALPGAVERIDQAEAAAARLVAHGYVPIGIDHFARPDDPLAIAARTGKLRRNFQGYTTDPADALIGFGASSIGKLPQGYIQNAPDVGGWRRAIEAGRLPIVRGKMIEREDIARAEIIERLMCDFAVDPEAIFASHGLPAEKLTAAYEALEPLVSDGIAVRDGARVSVPDDMHMFVRLVASAFDDYLERGAARHSVAV